MIDVLSIIQIILLALLTCTVYYNFKNEVTVSKLQYFYIFFISAMLMVILIRFVM
ncbi:hypothetical protein [Methanobrevibacter ruminantium]|uniref:hypothetical protein n=1 Tax=Methanobrevibacter ruminantium TaxID=83816 RepID=UPI003EFCF8E7